MADATVVPWGPVELAPEVGQRWHIGELDLRIKSIGNEWLVATSHMAPGEGVAAEPSASAEADDEDGVAWKRALLKREEKTCLLVPRMPDRSVVVRPEAPITLCVGSQATFFVSIPVTVQVTAGAEKTAVCEHPTAKLSNTWFGDPTNGELCYALRTRARRAVAPEGDAIHRALCPIHVHNRSEEELAFDRLCVRTANLGTFLAGEQLWTNAVAVTFRGAEHVSDVEVKSGAPEQTVGAVPMAQPRSPEPDGLFRKSFATIGSHIRF